MTLLKERASAKEVTETKNIVKMVVLLQEPRTARGVVAYLSHQRVLDPEVDIDRVFTNNKRQREIVNSGVLGIHGHGDAIRLCFDLRTTRSVDRPTETQRVFFQLVRGQALLEELSLPRRPCDESARRKEL